MLLFVDESGTDHKNAPYEVLAGISIREQKAWALISSIQDAQLEHFGVHFHDALREFKGSQLLKTKTFRLAGQMPPMGHSERCELALSLLEKGRRSREQNAPEPATRAELTAYGQASLKYAKRVLELCDQHEVKVFASIIDLNAPKPTNEAIRKDVMYLLERFHTSLESRDHGLIVFDELDVTQSRRLTRHMRQYFQETITGQQRAKRILPEPFFVHSDLTTLVQVADLVAYILNWAWRLEPKMTEPTRLELEPFAALVAQMEFKGTQRRSGKTWPLRGFCFISDLRPSRERTSGL